MFARRSIKKNGNVNEFRLDIHTLRFLNFTRYFVSFFTALAIISIITLLFVGPIIAFYTRFIHEIILGQIILEGLMMIAMLAFGLFLIKSWTGNFVLGGTFYLLSEAILEITDHPTDFTLAAGFWWIVIIIGGVALIITLLRIIALIIVWIKKGNPKPKLYSRKKRKHLAMALILISTATLLGAGYITTTSKDFGFQIKIQPQDYRIEFRIWANYHVSWYQNHPNGTEILEQLDRHNVTIQNTLFPLRDGEAKLESFSPTVFQDDIDNLVGNLSWFQTNYPNIRFQYYTFGIGHNSNGNYEGSIYTPAMAKRFVDVCRNYTLTNIVGIYTDWEGPNHPEKDQANNQTMNGWHQALWQDAFSYIRAYFPNWTLSCCHPDSTLYDGWDGDDDLQYFDRYNIFKPEWDDYGPMVYRSCDIDEDSIGDGSWKIYASAKSLLEGTLKNDVSKATMWLGCTGCGPYRNDTIVYEHGSPMKFGDSKGFDAFARDVLILKHFGFKTFSIFHGIDRFEQGGPLTGFFDQYGVNDALDRLNDTVNGENTTESFTIWSEGDWNPKSAIYRDMQLNFNQLEYIPIMVVFFGSGMLLIYIINKKEKKIRLE